MKRLLDLDILSKTQFALQSQVLLSVVIETNVTSSNQTNSGKSQSVNMHAKGKGGERSILIGKRKKKKNEKRVSYADQLLPPSVKVMIGEYACTGKQKRLCRRQGKRE